MKAFKKLSFMILTCLMMVSFLPETAFASSGTISLSDPTAAVGESVSVTVKATTSDSSTIGSVAMELTYDSSILEFDNGTSATNEDGIVKITSTADSSIKTYTLTFKALKAGTAAIKISSYEIKDSKSAVIEMSKVGSSTVTITGEEMQETMADATDVPSQDTPSEEGQPVEKQESLEDKIVNPPKKDVEVEIAGTPFTMCKITQDIIPDGFEYIGYQYGDVAVDAVRKGNTVLFYLNQIGEEPYIFYLYDDATGGFYKYAPITTSLDYSVIDIDESVVIPEGFTATEVSVGGVAVNGWQSNTNSEYYLLYLMTSEGEKNLYLYDAVEKTVQRYFATSTAAVTTETDSYQTLYTELNANYNKNMQSKTRVIYGLIILSVVLIFISINLGLRLSDKRHPILDDDDDEDEEEDQEFETKEYDNAQEDQEFETKEYDDVDDFEDEYDDPEVEEIKSDRQLKNEMKKAAKLEKKEKAKKEKEAKKMKKSSNDETQEEDDEVDLDDSDDFEMQIFDLDDDKK